MSNSSLNIVLDIDIVKQINHTPFTFLFIFYKYEPFHRLPSIKNNSLFSIKSSILTNICLRRYGFEIMNINKNDVALVRYINRISIYCAITISHVDDNASDRLLTFTRALAGFHCLYTYL